MNVEDMEKDPEVSNYITIMEARMKEAGISGSFLVYFGGLKKGAESEGLKIIDFNLEKIYFEVPKGYAKEKLQRVTKVIRLTLGLKTMAKYI